MTKSPTSWVIAWVMAKDLKPNDRIDLAGDECADPQNDRSEFSSEYQIVRDVIVCTDRDQLTAVVQATAIGQSGTKLVASHETKDFEVKVPADHRIKVRYDGPGAFTAPPTPEPKPEPEIPEKMRILNDFYNEESYGTPGA